MGKKLQTSIPYKKGATWNVDELIYLTDTKDSLSFYSMNYISPYNEGIDRTIKAVYKTEELTHLTYINNHIDYCYYFDGDIVNGLPNGKCHVSWNRAVEYIGEYVNGAWDGVGVYIDRYKDEFYEGEFKDGVYSGQGKLTKYDNAYEGVFEKGEFISGKKSGKNGEILEGVFKAWNLTDGTHVKDSTITTYKNGKIVKTKHLYSNGDSFEGLISRYSTSGVYLFANGDSLDGKYEYYEFTGESQLPFYSFTGKCNVKLPGDVTYNGAGRLNRESHQSVKDIVFHGQGKLTKSNGDFYEGTFENGKFVSGTCTETLDNGDVYAGEFSSVKYNGQGKLTKSNGNFYEGVFAEGKFGGNGIVTITDNKGFVYNGEYTNNKYNGNGTYSFASGDVIKGNSVNGVLSGICELQYANGDIYTGKLKNFLPIGLGEISYVSGERFSGNFANGFRNGEGTLITQSCTFVGTWANDIKNGSFVVSLSDGSSYNVVYKKDVCDKKIIISFSNGDKWEGEVENQTYKKGKYTFADGTMYDGTYENGGVLKVKVIGADGKRIKDVVEYRPLIPIHQEIFE